MYWARGLPNFAITQNADLLGAIGFVGCPSPGELEVAYWLVRDARGRGLATEALICVSQWALALPSVTKIRAEILVGNVRSLNCALRAGYSLSVSVQVADGAGGIHGSPLNSRTRASMAGMSCLRVVDR